MKKQKILNRARKSKKYLPHDEICFDCAKDKGGQADMAFTVSMGTCPYCKEKKYTSTITDYHWPRKYGAKFIWD